MKNGYDRYLAYQYRMIGDFFRNLFQAIQIADSTNIEKLRMGFPEEVDAYLTFSRIGAEEFLEKCSLDNPLVERMRAEYV